MVPGMDAACAASDQTPSASEPSRRPRLDVPITLPSALLLAIDALVGEKYLDRSEAIRSLLHDALRSQP